MLCFNNFLRLIIHTYKDLHPSLCPMCVPCPATGSPCPWFVLFDHETPLCCFLPVSCAWGLLSFWDLCVYSFHEIWKNFIHHLFTHLFCSPLFAGSPTTCTFGDLKLSHRTDTLFIFWKILFFVSHLTWSPGALSSSFAVQSTLYSIRCNFRVGHGRFHLYESNRLLYIFPLTFLTYGTVF